MSLNFYIYCLNFQEAFYRCSPHVDRRGDLLDFIFHGITLKNIPFQINTKNPKT